MAVPGSGTLELEELAREAYYGQYGGNATTYPITPPIFLYDLVNGGNSAGSGMSYPTVNTNCLPNPASRGSYVEMPAVFQGESGRTPVFVEYTYYLDPSEAATVQDINNGDTIYTDANLTTPVGQWDGNSPYRRYNFSAVGGAAVGGVACSSPELPVDFQTNSSGQITNINCAAP